MNKEDKNDFFKKVPENIKELVKSKSEDDFRFLERLPKKDKRIRKYKQKSKDVIFPIYNGYDFLENLLVVRHFVCKRYKISFELLEVFLYLYPKNFWTQDDYFIVPKQFTHNRMRYMLKKGHVVIFMKAKTERETIYRLSPSSRRIVEHFYKYLSGEDKMPVDSLYYSPFVSEKISAVDKLRKNLIYKINLLEPSENKKRLFE